jgi:subfamily B ATP-binding cassette protein MsbA
MSGASAEHRDTASVRSFRLLRPFGGGLLFVVGLLCLLTMADMAAPFFLKLLIDDVFPHEGGGGGNWSLLWFILPGMVLVYVARNTLFFTSRMRALRISEDLCFDLRKRLFEHLQRLSLSFYRSHQPGKVSARLMDDTFKIQSFIQDKLPTLLRYVIEFQVLLIIIYVINWRLALASTIVLPLHLLTWRVFRGSIRRSSSEAQESLAAAHGNIVEKFLGMEVVKGFSAEERESSSFHEAIDASRQSQIKTQRFHFAQKVVADLLVGVGTVVLLGYGAYEVFRGAMQPGSFVMFFWYVRMLYPAVLEIISGAGHLSRATASVDRVFEMLDEPVAEQDVRSSTTIELAELSGRIQYEHLGFCYDPEGPAILKDINLTVEPGEHVAIAGPSGSGKSTLISLLPRFNEATTGRLRIDDRPVETISIRALRGLFGIVFQEVFLFNASIYENLRYARPDATLDEVIEACRITGAHNFIQRLPDGYYTRVGGSGVEMSRGEKQRITLARALVRDPKVLVIDEATASIDSVAATEIMTSILELMKGRTVIMVTHDIDLIDLVDRVVAIDNGRVVFDGPPADFEGADLLVSSRGGSPGWRRRGPGRAGTRETEPKPRPSTTRARRSSRPPNGGLAGILLLAALVLTGCVRSSKTTRSIELDQPKVSSGVMLDEAARDEAKLREFAERLDEIVLDLPDIATLPRDPIAPLSAMADPPEPTAPDVEPLTIQQAARMLARHEFPPDAVRLVSLPKLSEIELSELIERAALRLNAEAGYVDAGSALADTMPALPQNVRDGHVLARQSEQGTRVLRFGVREYLSQPPQLWVLGVTVSPGGALLVNEELDLVQPAVNDMIASLEEMRGKLTVRDLESRMIQLSYTDAPTALKMLKGMGATGVDTPEQVPKEVDFQSLPFVVAVPDPAAGDIGLIGEGARGGGQFGLSLVPSVASQLSPNNVASPMTQLLVMFHPAHPEQFSYIKALLDDYIDRPARQIFVEGMVLEISEQGLVDLGIEWELDQGPVYFNAGTLNADGLDDTFRFETEDADFWRVFTRDFPYIFSLKIRALVREGKAEVLSRPSVLTLNNRQSTIRVGEDIPIATSQEGVGGGSQNKISFNFKYLPVGILLNIRPRINQDGSEVSMLIDTIVSSVVPGEDLEIRSSDGDLLASAPTVSSRRVQTYSRIRNNTPFIIGGLVSREKTTQQDKIPLLGDLPLIGFAFRAEKNETLKREVIIVLTPYVLPEDQTVARELPKDEDLFDSFGNELFRDAYRIRTEDVFDLSFLFENRRLNAFRDLAEEAIDRNFRLAEQQPFKSFVGGRIPGEEMLVTRMLYEVVKRLDAADDIDLRRIIYFEGQNVGGYDVRFLERTLAALGKGLDYRKFFETLKGKALAVTFEYDRESMDEAHLASEPIPTLSLVDCPNRDVWGELLWELNQPLPDGRERYTILIHQPTDLLRLRRALVLKRVIALNGGDEQLLMRNFSVGKLLLMPELKEGQIHVIDSAVARYFFHTELYYAATISEIERRLEQLDELLNHPSIDDARRDGVMPTPAPEPETLSEDTAAPEPEEAVAPEAGSP